METFSLIFFLFGVLFLVMAFVTMKDGLLPAIPYFMFSLFALLIAGGMTREASIVLIFFFALMMWISIRERSIVMLLIYFIFFFSIAQKTRLTPEVVN